MVNGTLGIGASQLGIAHPVEGKIISGTEGSLGDGTHQRS